MSEHIRNINADIAIGPMKKSVLIIDTVEMIVYANSSIDGTFDLVPSDVSGENFPELKPITEIQSYLDVPTKVMMSIEQWEGMSFAR